MMTKPTAVLDASLATSFAGFPAATWHSVIAQASSSFSLVKLRQRLPVSLSVPPRFVELEPWDVGDWFDDMNELHPHAELAGDHCSCECISSIARPRSTGAIAHLPGQFREGPDERVSTGGVARTGNDDSRSTRWVVDPSITRLAPVKPCDPMTIKSHLKRSAPEQSLRAVYRPLRQSSSPSRPYH